MTRIMLWLGASSLVEKVCLNIVQRRIEKNGHCPFRLLSLKLLRQFLVAGRLRKMLCYVRHTLSIINFPSRFL